MALLKASSTQHPIATKAKITLNHENKSSEIIWLHLIYMQMICLDSNTIALYHMLNKTQWDLHMHGIIRNSNSICP